MRIFQTIAFLLLLIIPYLTHSQNDAITFHEKKVVGVDYSTGGDVTASRIHFDQRIEHTYLDSPAQILTLELRDLTKNKKYYKAKGAVVQYDLEDNKMLWSKDVNYNNTHYAHFNNLMIRTKGKKSICIDTETGQEKWELHNHIAHVFPGSKVAMGYKTQGRDDKFLSLQGINLDNGAVIWQRSIDRTFGWREMVNLNDSTVLISSSGIHSVNFKTGKGWSHREEVGKNKNNFWTGRDILTNICSNIALDSISIYFASSNSIASYSMDGSQIWNQPLHTEYTSKSQLFFYGEDQLILVNFGKANSAMRYEKRYGQPYVSIYNRNSGERLKYLSLPGDKDYIRYISMRNDILYLLFEKRMVTIDLKEQRIINSASPGIKLKKEILYPITWMTYYEVEPDSILPLFSIDTTSYFYKCEENVIAGFDSNIQVKKVLSFDKVYVLLGIHDGLFYISNGKKGYAVNDINEILFEFEARLAWKYCE